MKPSQFLFKGTKMILLMLVLFASSCKKFIAVSPPDTQVTEATVYNDDKMATSVITVLYKQMADNYSVQDITGINESLSAIFLCTGLSGDELGCNNPSDNSLLQYVKYYKNRLGGIKGDDAGTYFWSNIYKNIFTINTSLEGIGNSSGLTPAVKQQLLGEAKFMRALCYFYLVNLYGNLPLIVNTDYKQSSLLSRMPVNEVYDQIIQDLHEAQKLLSVNYLDGTLLKTTVERLRPTQMAATALLSRAYLYAGNWAGADSAATAVIENSAIFNLTSLDNIFLNNSNEAIWQLQNKWDNKGTNVAEALIPIVVGNQTSSPVFISKQLLNSFEEGDNRRQKWIDSVTVADGTVYYYANKYKNHFDGEIPAPQTERLTVLRLTEQYLIRANARLKLGDIQGAQDDLNRIRSRAGLPGIIANDEPTLLAAITQERRVELFTEWGDRWFELKRIGKIDEVMNEVCLQKETTWSPNWQLYPLPYNDLITDKNLNQNPGY